MEGNLVLLRKADVPEYLRDSEFFSSLCDDDGHGDYFEVPEFCYRSSTLVRSQEDLDHLLSTLRYWCVSKPVDFLLPMLLKGLDFEISNIVSKFGNELTSIIELVEIGQQPTFGEKVALTIEFGDLSILKTLLGLATEDSDHKRTPALPLANRTNRAGHTQR